MMVQPSNFDEHNERDLLQQRHDPTVTNSQWLQRAPQEPVNFGTPNPPFAVLRRTPSLSGILNGPEPLAVIQASPPA